MPERLELDGRCGASCAFRLEEKEGKVCVHGHNVGIALMETTIGQDVLDRLLAMLRERKHAGYDKEEETMSEDKNYNIAYVELLNRCWEDPEYLAKFREDPASALEDFGIPTVPDVTYHVVPLDDMKPSTDKDVYLPYQDKPGLQTLEDNMLEDAAGGGFVYKHSNFLVNANAVAQNDAIGYSEAIGVTISVEVAYG